MGMANQSDGIPPRPGGPPSHVRRWDSMYGSVKVVPVEEPVEAPVVPDAPQKPVAKKKAKKKKAKKKGS